VRQVLPRYNTYDSDEAHTYGSLTPLAVAERLQELFLVRAVWGANAHHTA